VRAALFLLAAGACAPTTTISPPGGDVWDVSVPVAVRGRGTCVVDLDGREVARATDTLSVRVPITTGDNHVVARCTRTGATAARFFGRLTPRPVARIFARREGERVVLDASASATSRVDPAAIVAYTWEGARGDGPVVELAAPRARLVVTDARGRTDEALYDEGPRDPGVIYGIHPPTYGGFRGIKASLPRLADLGVGTVWLTPVFEAPAEDFGYAVTDPHRVRRAWGTEEELAALVDEAHHLGLRVILDFVPNHTSVEHPYVREARTRAFYVRDSTGAPTHYFDWAHLPNLAYDNPEVQTMMFDATLGWLRRAHVDGFRFDAAWGIAERSPDVWPRWVQEIRRVRPDAFLLAEAPARDTRFATWGFDAAYDWGDGLGQWAWERVFEGPNVADRIDEALTKSPGPNVLRFLDNNDTGKRFVTRYGEGMTHAALGLLLTVPGVPCLYAGTEEGAEYEPYKDRVVLPRAENALAAHTRRLLHLRRTEPALRSAPLERVPVADPLVYAFRRGAVVVVVSFGEVARVVDVGPRRVALAPWDVVVLR